MTQSTTVGMYTVGADITLSSGNIAKELERINTDFITNGVTSPLSQPNFVRYLVYVDGDTSWWNVSVKNDITYPVDIDFNAALIFYR